MTDSAKTIRAARRAARMTQDDLAGRAGVSARSIRRIERGEPVSPDVIRSVCAALGVDAETLPPVGDGQGRARSPVGPRPVADGQRWAAWAQVAIPLCVLALLGGAMSLAFLSIRLDGGMVRGWAAYSLLSIAFLCIGLLPGSAMRALSIACVGLAGLVETCLGIPDMAASPGGPMAAALSLHALACVGLAASFFGGVVPATSVPPGAAQATNG